MKILVINGPNLNLLGEREPAVYGGDSLQAINDELFAMAKNMGYDMSFFQSSNEGSIIDRLHEANNSSKIYNINCRKNIKNTKFAKF